MSTRRKGLSEEEKRTKLIEFFHKSAEVFSMKEVESRASEETDLTQVKETLLELARDGTIQSDKIGASNYYWSFPSFELGQKKEMLNDLQNELNEINEKIQVQKKKVETLSVGREVNEIRNKKIEQLENLKNENTSLKQELEQYGDQELMEELKTEIKTAKEATNRYTDNIDSLRRYCNDKYNIMTDDFNRNFEIDPNMEYLEDYPAPPPPKSKSRR
eukprot:gene6031-7515_t